MTDLPGFSSADTAKLPTKRELDREERDFRALAQWHRTTDLGAVRKALGLKSNAEAQVRINRARTLLMERRAEFIEEEFTRDAMLLRDMTTVLAEAFFAGDMARVGDIVKVMERRAKLLGSDTEKDEAGGPQVLVIDSRPPWERGETIDGEAVDATGLPAGD